MHKTSWTNTNNIGIELKILSNYFFIPNSVGVLNDEIIWKHYVKIIELLSYTKWHGQDKSSKYVINFFFCIWTINLVSIG